MPKQMTEKQMRETISQIAETANWQIETSEDSNGNLYFMIYTDCLVVEEN